MKAGWSSAFDVDATGSDVSWELEDRDAGDEGGDGDDDGGGDDGTAPLAGRPPDQPLFFRDRERRPKLQRMLALMAGIPRQNYQEQ